MLTYILVQKLMPRAVSPNSLCVTILSEKTALPLAYILTQIFLFCEIVQMKESQEHAKSEHFTVINFKIV
jgi:hypothetical protein